MPHSQSSSISTISTATSKRNKPDVAVMPKIGLLKSIVLTWRFLFAKPPHTEPASELPVKPLTQADLLAAPNRSVFRLGHSTVLLKLRDQFWITDPVFAQRASPVQWAGPRRFHPSPISIQALPPIKAVILSHDHYDHLDRTAIEQLAAKTEYFLTPLGVGEHLIRWGVDRSKVHQLDWWQSIEIAGLELTATPAQHFSGRSLFDKNRSLWASWVIIDAERRIFFSGDSGYFEGFKQIGERFGPFDLTLIETGAYDINWPDIHMQPEQSLQAHLDLRGHWLMPIHNGSFDLALHAWNEPLERISALAQTHGIPISTPQMGELVHIEHPHNNPHWWRVAELTATWTEQTVPLVKQEQSSGR